MTPVVQSKLVDRDGYGTCWSACLASLLDLPERAVPHFADDTRFPEGCEDDARARFVTDLAYGRKPTDWWTATLLWLELLGHTIHGLGSGAKDRLTAEFVIASGLSPRSPGRDGKPIYHSVIYRRQTDGSYALAHDPYPDGTGIIGDPDTYYELVPG